MPLLPKDELRLKAGGQVLTGWQRVTLRAGIEVFPNQMILETTPDAYKNVDQLGLSEGQPFEAWLGPDKVMSGFIAIVDGVVGSQTQFDIVGEGKCCDLAECSAEIPSGQITQQSVKAIAEILCQPYGIKVVSLSPEADTPVIPQRALNYGETPYQILDWLCKVRPTLFYENADGDLVLSAIGTARAKGGVTEGDNMQMARGRRSVNQRYSEIRACLMNVNLYLESGSDKNFLAPVFDTEVKRHRLLYIVAETGDAGQEVVRKRAAWEVARRRGRGLPIWVVVDSWRDAGGVLWTPNTLCPVDIPSLGIIKTDFLLSSVTFMQDDRGGTTANLELMPPDAFAIEPILAQPTFAEIPGGIQ